MLLIGVSSALFALAQPPHDAWWLGPLALVPLLSVLLHADARTCALSGMLFGTASGAGIASWLLPGLATAGAGNAASAIGLIGVPLIVAGVPWAIFGISSGLLARRFPQHSALMIAVILGGVDFARSSVPGGVPWALLGHSQWSAPGLAQLAAVAGVPLVSAVLAWCNGAIAALWHAPRSARRRTEAAAAVVFCAALWLGGVRAVEGFRTEASAPAFAFLLVQPNLPAGERWNPALQDSNLGIVTRMTSEALRAAETAPDLILWPESTLTVPLEEGSGVDTALAEWLARSQVPVVAGVARRSETGRANRYRNAAVWWNPQGETVASVEKQVAVPLIESEGTLGIPEGIWRWLGVPRDGLLVERGNAGGPLRGPIETTVLLCYEVIFPRLSAERRSPDTIALLNLANDSWFGTSAVSRQQIAYGAFRAIEQRLPLVRVAHGGESIVIDPLGRVVASLPHDTSGTLRVSVQQEAPSSLVERAAIAAVGLGPAGLVLGMGGLTRRRRR